MKTMKLWRIAFMMLAAFSLASCSSDDDNEDKVEQVTLYVSAETGTYQNVPDNNYVEGMGRECLLLRLVPRNLGLHLRARS